MVIGICLENHQFGYNSIVQSFEITPNDSLNVPTVSCDVYPLLIMFIWILCLLISFIKGLFIFFIFSKNKNKQTKKQLLILVPGLRRKVVCTGERVCTQKLTASGTGGSHRASEAEPFSGSTHPTTFLTRGRVSTRPGRLLPQDRQEPSWFQDTAKK